MFYAGKLTRKVGFGETIYFILHEMSHKSMKIHFSSNSNFSLEIILYKEIKFNFNIKY